MENIVNKIIEILDEYSKNENYIIDNYTTQQKINFLNFINDNTDEFVEIVEQKNLKFMDDIKIFKPNEALNILLKKDKIDSNKFLDNILIRNLDDEGKFKLIEQKADKINDDDFFIRILKEKKDSLEKDVIILIVNNIKNDEKRFEILEEINESVYFAYYIVSSINDDKFKLKYIKENQRFDIYYWKEIVTSITDDEMKYNLALEYRNIIGESNFLDILASLKSDEKKIDLILYNTLKISWDSKSKLIKSIKDVELRFSISVSEALKEKNYGWLEEVINHDDEIIKSKTINYALLNFYSKNNSLNLENLIFFVEKFGNVACRYLSNENVKKIINSDKEIFNKFLEIFNKEEFLKLNESVVDSVYDSIIQRIFRNSNIENIFYLFQELNLLVESNDKEGLIKRLKQIKNTGLVDFEKYNININELVNNLLYAENRKESLAVLRNITEEYLIKSRNKYFEERKQNLTSDLSLEIRYDKKTFVNKILSTNSIDSIIKILDEIDIKFLNEESINLLKDKELLIECLNFKKDPLHSQVNFSRIKDYLKVLNSIFGILYEKEYQNLNKIMKLDEPLKNESYVTNFNNINKENLIKIMCEVDIEQLQKRLFNNQFLYNELLNILKKYKILGWGNTFDKILEEAKIEYDQSTVSALLSYFYKFYPVLLEKQKNGEIKSITLLNLMDEISIYGSFSNQYKILLGKEDYNLYAKNPAPLSAPITKEERLEVIPEKIKIMFNRKYITVPTIDEQISLDNQKSLCVCIGNVSEPINLTYGERTGACMRVGGLGDTLFEFCLKNENGFHVRITNPENGALVSRVSGFRNGNTVFLNQLRYSLDEQYDNEDLVETIKKVAEILIEKTRQSEYPIENIIISKDYAMEKYKKGFVNLGRNIKIGYDHFYSDVNEHNAILLASAKGNSLLELKLTPENAERYEVLRAKIKCLTQSDEIVSNINRIHLIDSLLKKIDVSEVELEYTNLSINKLYIGEDWYIALDENNNIIKEFYIDRGLNKTLEEMNSVKNNLINNTTIIEERNFVI